ncbi:MAG: DoxX family protein [Bryobacterales bacterium]|nr:DoxX family protein [Bryobacterales bacterium]
MKNWILGGTGGASATSDLGLLVLRVVAGLSMALGHGIKKLPPPEAFVKGVTGMGMPSFMAWGATVAEFGGGLLLVIGLFTRPAAFLWIVTMSVALLGVHAKDPFARQELALLYLSMGILFLLAGPGRFAVDRLIRK